MRRAMIEAEVGDDILDGDPTTRKLEERIADLLGMDAALFFPSGTQANQTGIWLATDRGTEVVLEANAHIVHYEMAGAAGLSGAQIRPVTTPEGILTRELAAQAVRPEGMHQPKTSAIAAENTHNVAGGKVTPLAVWDGLVELAREMGLHLHLDGARIWNAAAALGEPPARVARGATTVSVCLSKGLGCPVGSCLAASADLISEARDVRRRLGGSMRQSGILAAAGLYALEHNLARIGDDHANARLLADKLAGHPAARPLPPESNIVMLDLTVPGLTALAVITKLAEAGVLLVPFSTTRLRAVTHLDVSATDVAAAAEIIGNLLGEEEA
jgi:threonine aldolase